MIHFSFASKGNLWPQRASLWLFGATLLCSMAQAETVRWEQQFRCRWCQFTEQSRAALAAAASDSNTSPRKYAPSREVDIQHLALDITPAFAQRQIQGVATLKFKPIAKPLPQLQLDAEELKIDGVTASVPVQNWQYDDHRLTITFANALAADAETTVTVRYRAEPQQGLYFRTPEMGYRPEDTHLWTQGEPLESRHWFPCFDAPNEKFTSEVICRVPQGMIARSNGRLVSTTPDAATGLTAYHWAQEKPHVTYLICLVAGKFRGIEDRHGEVPLGFWTPTSQIDFAKSSFRDTRSMMGFFERETGFSYPWAKYDQVVVDDYTWGGMENTSITILTDGTLFPEEFNATRSSRGLVAHELAHQWFGDLVTCKDWSHLWLNEGFATYYDALQSREQLGQDEFLYNMLQNARGVLSSTDGTPIVWREYKDPVDQFGYRAYPKGAWVLHMLRSQLGDDLYRQCIRTYLQRHAFGVVETSDLHKVIEEFSGRSFDRFFDQWLYHGHHPELKVSYSWDESTRLAKISVEQTQKVGGSIMLFDFPLPVRWITPSGTIEKTLRIQARSEDFQIPLPAAPDLVRVDPQYTVLAQIAFDIPDAMWHRQLKLTNDVIGRLLAVEALSKKQNKESVEQLKETLNTDAFYGVRSEAAGALKSIHSEEAFQALKASLDQPDPRVRAEVIRALDGFYRAEVGEIAQRLAKTDPHPEVRLAAARLLGRPGALDGAGDLVGWLGTNSYKSELASVVLSALRDREDPTVLPALLRAVQQLSSQWTTQVQAKGLSTLAWLARHQENKSAVREFISEHVRHPKQSIRRAAIKALGDLGDDPSIPLLRTFAEASKTSPEQIDAEAALKAIRDKRRPAPELGDLRREVTDLQKENRELKQSVEALKQKFEAILPAKPATNAVPAEK